ncbi:hypothetical protein LPUS_09124 [Lasallia pustulata]|uniref:Uncharacterized protein n=1 Tax=Lasallia pustulata TaxID=136370 RepID=A0A1W5D6V3_9LECA|nr:hypothetical protein LPUS_09124 [Lasallia pustulata]
MKKAHRQFMKIARAYWARDGKVSSKAPKGIEKVAGKAAAYLGRMSLRGEGIEQNFEKARIIISACCIETGLGCRRMGTEPQYC